MLSAQRLCNSSSPITSPHPAHAQWHITLFFLLVGAGGLISFCKIRRHIRVMFSTTTGVLMFTAIRKRLSAGDEKKPQSVHMGYLPQQGCPSHLPPTSCLGTRTAPFCFLKSTYPDGPQAHHSVSGAPSSCPPWRWNPSAATSHTEDCLPGRTTG